MTARMKWESKSSAVIDYGLGDQLNSLYIAPFRYHVKTVVVLM
jgi:hypothetical protein